MKKADWIVRIEMARFFESKAELRARTSKGTFKDKIHRAVFASTLEDKFDAMEIAQALDSGYIAKEQIFTESVRNIYVWLEKECEYQPVWHKRVFQQAKSWLVNKGILE